MQEQSQQLHVADGRNHSSTSMGEVRRPRPRHSKGGVTNYNRQRPSNKVYKMWQGKAQARDRCSAKTAICKGHYSAQCFSKTVAATTQEGEAWEDAAFLACKQPLRRSNSSGTPEWR